MFKNRYEKELDNIKADEAFKARTIKMLEERQSSLYSQSSAENTISFYKTRKFKKYIEICACAALAFVCIFAFGKDNLIKSDSSSVGGIEGFSLASTAREFTKADAAPVNETTEAAAKQTTLSGRIGFGGMGFEGLMAYDVSEIYPDSPYDIYSSSDSFAYYAQIPLTLGQAENKAEEILSFLGKKCKSKKYNFTKIIRENGVVTQHTSIASDSADIPDKAAVLNNVYYNFDGGQISADMLTGRIFVSLDAPINLGFGEDFSIKDNQNEFSKAVLEKFSPIINMENPTASVWSDYTYNGEQNFCAYVYDKSEDSQAAAMNSSLNGAEFYLADNSVYAFAFLDSDYEKAGEYPAITAFQALTLLYDGNYVTSVPYEITDDTVVNKIQLVYIKPYFNQTELKYEGYALPCYKFFVELPQEQQENGLNTYGVYYVGAIDPKFMSLAPVEFN